MELGLEDHTLTLRGSHQRYLQCPGIQAQPPGWRLLTARNPFGMRTGRIHPIARLPDPSSIPSPISWNIDVLRRTSGTMGWGNCVGICPPDSTWPFELCELKASVVWTPTTGHSIRLNFPFPSPLRYLGLLNVCSSGKGLYFGSYSTMRVSCQGVLPEITE